jgi:YVTN family beta-propeller protein
VIDTTSNSVVTTIEDPRFDLPVGVAVAPDGRHVYVTNFSSNTVLVIDTTTNNVVTTIGVGRSPTGVAATDRNVYVVNRDSNTVSVIDV